MPKRRGLTVMRLHCIAKSMDVGVPFIFQIVLLLILPLAFAYLITVAGLALVSLRAALRNLLRGRRGQSDSTAPPGERLSA
jgi:hypothetical protein